MESNVKVLTEDRYPGLSKWPSVGDIVEDWKALL